MTDLKPCPFCGSDAELHDHRLCWSAQCIRCNASVVGDRVDELESEADEQSVDWDAIKQTAITAWNTRTDNWQPIETAPHGELVLLFCPDRGCPSNRKRIELDYASHGERIGNTSTMSFHSWATKWQPLPAPPKETTK